MEVDSGHQAHRMSHHIALAGFRILKAAPGLIVLLSFGQFNPNAFTLAREVRHEEIIFVRPMKAATSLVEKVK